jgi:hypothetical protein
MRATGSMTHCHDVDRYSQLGWKGNHFAPTFSASETFISDW